MTIGLNHFLVLAAILFAIGLLAALSKRNPISVLMGIELMLNSVNINLIAFNRFLNPDVASGAIFMMIVLVVAAAEVAAGVAIIMKHYRQRGNADLATVNWLKW